ncbi:hypothetical protein K504DRAFT_457284 [Pleomassaria siparia CBS 279.74]|uniref:Uncharacterized protein n=1 Tax=Pleomassaria siparia CBS 279.74 TaxID=1314801 RepID=A0A6G1KQH9_9PLEO|nr:hypothetical protein K504DRAFT_457284 [Pleomassaria siparia CBS 279.74]
MENSEGNISFVCFSNGQSTPQSKPSVGLGKDVICRYTMMDRDRVNWEKVRNVDSQQLGDVGVDWGGLGWIGMDWDGLVRMNWSGLEWMDWSGLEWMDWSGLEWMDWSGLEWMDWSGLGWMDWSGLA